MKDAVRRYNPTYFRAQHNRHELYAAKLAKQEVRKMESAKAKITKFFNDNPSVTKGVCDCRTDFDENSGSYCEVTNDLTMNVHEVYPGTITLDQRCVIIKYPKSVCDASSSTCDMSSECDDMVSDAIQVGFGNATMIPLNNQTDCDASDCFTVSNHEDPFIDLKINALCHLLENEGYIRSTTEIEKALAIMSIVFGSLVAACCLIVLCRKCIIPSIQYVTREAPRIEHLYTEIVSDADAPRKRTWMAQP